MSDLIKNIILPFYKNQISVDDFMLELKKNASFAELIDKDKFMLNQLKKSALGSFIKKPSEYLALIYTKNKVNAATAIWVQIRDFLSQDKYYCYLENDDRIRIILNCIIDMDWFYNADTFIESYIKEKIIEPLSSLNLPLSQLLKEAKSIMLEHFKSDKSMPQWIQNCNWPFEDNGQPMVFVGQMKDHEEPNNTIFMFRSKSGDRIVEVKQHD